MNMELFKKIDSNEVNELIVKSNVDSHILVNAGPGSGKTYTVIARLLFLLKQPNIKPNEILVICYTCAATDVIRTRIEEEIKKGNIDSKAREASVCTFDSLVTNYLVEIEYNDFDVLDYNDRINLFNELIAQPQHKKFFSSNFCYLIIDELQDLVNDRAVMVLNLLNKCFKNKGYLLLGDRCQAIYDYDCDCNNNINRTYNSDEFYNWLDKNISKNTSKYEIIGNKRQTDLLQEKCNKLRNAILYNESIFFEVFKNNLDNEIVHIDNVFASISNINDSRECAILCRTNGEAEYVSWNLWKASVDHNLIRKNNEQVTLSRLICDIYNVYSKNEISKEEFVESLRKLSKFDLDKCESIFKTINGYIYDDGNLNQKYLDFSLLIKRICKNIEVPECLLNRKKSNITVTTIHKAKGREYDTVYILGDDFTFSINNKFKCTNLDDYTKLSKEFEETKKVLYVAETRARKNVFIINKGETKEWYFFKSDENRWIRSKYGKYLCNYATGLSEDIDYSSFVEGDFENAKERQKYISTKIKIGDKINLKYEFNKYNIYHYDKLIGYMSQDYIDKLYRKKFNNKIYAYKCPAEIRELYVRNVITFISSKEYPNVPLEFRKSRIWYGIEISGFGEIKF